MELRKEEKVCMDTNLTLVPSECHHHHYTSPLADPIIAIDQPTGRWWVGDSLYYPLQWSHMGFK